MEFKQLSIIIPVYNEEKTILKVLNLITELKLTGNIKKEILIIDDGSTDNTNAIITEFIKNNSNSGIKFFSQQNKGKGSAVRNGIKNSTGDYIIIQDADLELNPAEINLLLQSVIDGAANVVYGTRFPSTGKRNKNVSRLFYMANKFVTFFSNVINHLELTDMMNCYKLVRNDLINKINLLENGFGIEPEITCKLSQLAEVKFGEVCVSYHPRLYSEEKKIKFIDGIKVLFCIIKYGLLSGIFAKKKGSA